jgi:hypothetical protein
MAWRTQVACGGTLVFQPDAVVYHRVEPGVRELTRRARLYGAGEVLLEQRWMSYPGYVGRGPLLHRTQPVWSLPLRLISRLLDRRPLSPPLFEADVALNWEIGRLVGRIVHRHADMAPLVPAATRDDARPGA